MLRHLLGLILLSIIIAGCAEQGPSDSHFFEDGKLSIKFNKQDIPSDVSEVLVFLTRENYQPISSNLTITDSSSAELLLESVAEGIWHLKVDALNANQEILYTGETDINVIANQTVPVFLTLNPVNSGTGNIQIFVSWGTNSAWTNYFNNPIIVRSFTQYDWYGVAESYVIKDEDKFKMWYQGVMDNGRTYIFYAESFDGFNWQKYGNTPVLYPGDYDNWDSGAVGTPVVLKTNAGYRMYYTGWQDPYGAWGIGLAYSTDGINWEKHGAPLISGINNPTGMKISAQSVIQKNELFIMYFSAKNGLYDHTISAATSSDGINWSMHSSNPILAASESWEGMGVYFPSVKQDNEILKMVYSNSGAPVSGFGMATSTDGLNWNKEANPIFTENDSSPDIEKIGYPCFLKTDSKYWLYYSTFYDGIWSINLATKSLQ